MKTSEDRLADAEECISLLIDHLDTVNARLDALEQAMREHHNRQRQRLGVTFDINEHMKRDDQ